jgi:hypothetical protein
MAPRQRHFRAQQLLYSLHWFLTEEKEREITRFICGGRDGDGGKGWSLRLFQRVALFSLSCPTAG